MVAMAVAPRVASYQTIEVMGESGNKNLKLVEYKKTNIPVPIKIGISGICALLLIPAFYYWGPLVIIIALAEALACAALWTGFKKREVITKGHLPQTFQDEGGELITAAHKINKASKITPEGSDVRVRAEEFNRLVYAFLTTLKELNIVNEISGGSSREFYSDAVKIKERMNNLRMSAEELIQMVGIRKVDSVKADLDFLGDAEFIEHVSIETQIYRSLNEGK